MMVRRISSVPPAMRMPGEWSQECWKIPCASALFGSAEEAEVSLCLHHLVGDVEQLARGDQLADGRFRTGRLAARERRHGAKAG